MDITTEQQVETVRARRSIFPFNTHNHTVDEDADGLTAVCNDCGNKERFGTHAQAVAIDMWLHQHYKDCPKRAVVAA